MRWLKVLVIGMGVLILVGLTVVIVTIVNRSDAPGKSAASAARPSPPVIGAPSDANRPMSSVTRAQFGDRRIAIPAGATAEEVTSDARRLTIRLRLANGKAALLLIDAMTGEKIGLITLDDTGQ